MQFHGIAQSLNGALAGQSIGAFAILGVALALWIVIGAAVLLRKWRLRGTVQPPPRRRLWENLRLLVGPLPISIAIHVGVLLLLIAVIKQRSAPAMIVVRLEGGGSGVNRPAAEDLPPPNVAMPETAPQDISRPPIVTASQDTNLQTDYVRAVNRGVFNVDTGDAMGLGYGRALGNSFGGYIGRLRRKGLDVVLVIDGTGSMGDVIDDVKTRMTQLVLAIHRLVPTARIGVVEFGGRGEPIEVHPFTLSSQQLEGYLDMIQSKGGGEWQEDTLGGIRAAVTQMPWRPSAKKVIVLVGDTPPFDEDVPKVKDLIEQFRAEDGTFNTVDVTVEEHERFQRDLYFSIHGVYPKTIPPLQPFYLQTQHAYQQMAAEGGGEWRSLTKDMQINQQVLILAFGRNWQSQVAAFGADLTTRAP